MSADDTMRELEERYGRFLDDLRDLGVKRIGFGNDLIYSHTYEMETVGPRVEYVEPMNMALRRHQFGAWLGVAKIQIQCGECGCWFKTRAYLGTNISGKCEHCGAFNWTEETLKRG